MDEIKIGLLGEKLAHSYSKIIHEMMDNVPFNLYEVSVESFDDFMKKRNFRAINVTIPYKEKVIPYLDFISDKAKRIGAVNVVVNKNGKLYGYNTDYDGFKYLLEKNNFNVLNKKCLILGSGGTSKTVSLVLNDLKAKEIVIVSRNKENYLHYNEIDFDNYDYIINTTPVGMYPYFNESLISNKLNKVIGIVDVIYNPLRTKIHLLNKDIKYINGLEMLIYQAIESHNIFFSNESVIDKKEIEKVLDKLKKSILNVVLIGMPSSGKSTIAKRLSERLKIEYLDTDELIKNKTKKNIEEIFNSFGEKKFREIENEVVKDVSLEVNKIISTGGGVVLNKENIDLLKANGIVIYLKRNIDEIINDFNYNRPLAKTKEEIKKLYEERKDIYLECADFVIDNDDIESTIDKIIQVI